MLLKAFSTVTNWSGLCKCTVLRHQCPSFPFPFDIEKKVFPIPKCRKQEYPPQTTTDATRHTGGTKLFQDEKQGNPLEGLLESSNETTENHMALGIHLRRNLFEDFRTLVYRKSYRGWAKSSFTDFVEEERSFFVLPTQVLGRRSFDFLFYLLPKHTISYHHMPVALLHFFHCSHLSH